VRVAGVGVEAMGVVALAHDAIDVLAGQVRCRVHRIDAVAAAPTDFVQAIARVPVAAVPGVVDRRRMGFHVELAVVHGTTDEQHAHGTPPGR
jgi:hypothetical protein